MATSKGVEPVQIIYDNDVNESEETGGTRLEKSGEKTLVSQNHSDAFDSSKTKTDDGVSEKEGQILANIDLSNPDDIIDLLEKVDLSEEDTEALLKDAYKMNRQLHMMLKQQEQEDAIRGKNNVKTKKNQPRNTSTHARSQKSGSSSSSSSRVGSAAFSSKDPLPPITQSGTTDGIYSMKMKRSTTNIPIQRPSEHTSIRAKSTKQTQSSKGDRVGSASRKSRSKLTSSAQRPDWNDRFSYS